MRSEGHKFVDIAFVGSMFTASFDLFLNLQISGFSFRIAELLWVVPILWAVLLCLRSRKVNWPLGFLGLSLWTMLILLFIPHTSYIRRSLGYGMWLVLCVSLVFALVQLYGHPSRIRWLVTWYVSSFAFVAGFGILQFLLCAGGFGHPLVVQWWAPRVARINGFSYEPSYYATYLITGWVFILYLFEKRVGYINRPWLMIATLLVTTALILSSSRMGWLLMIVWATRYVYIYIATLFTRGITRRDWVVAAIVLLALLALVLMGIVFGAIGHLSLLLKGLGIGGGGNYSSGPRIAGLIDTWHAFIRSPFIGYSLGGLSGAIGSNHGVPVTSQSTAELYQGACVLIQVLAASGLLGFTAFVYYIFQLCFRPLCLPVETRDRDLTLSLRGMVYAFLFLLLILEFNQNILRQYVWLHIGLLSAMYHAHKRGRANLSITPIDGTSNL